MQYNNLIYCLESPVFDLEKYNSITENDHFVPALYKLDSKFNWQRFYQLLAKWCIKHPAVINKIVGNCGGKREDVENQVLKLVLTNGQATHEDIALILQNGFKLSKNLLVSMLTDAKLIADEDLLQTIVTLADKNIYKSAIHGCLRQLFSSGNLADLRLAMFLKNSLGIDEEQVLGAIVAAPFDHEMFYLLRKYKLPMKTLFGLKHGGIPDDYWQSLKIFGVESAVMDVCWHDLVVGGVIDQFQMMTMSKSVMNGVSKILSWTKGQKVQKLSAAQEAATIKSMNSMLSMGLKLTPSIFHSISTIIFDTAPTKRFVYLLAQVEKDLLINEATEQAEDWVGCFETVILQNEKWISILSNHTHVFFQSTSTLFQTQRPLSPQSQFSSHDNMSPASDDWEFDDLDDTKSVSSQMSTTSSISSSIMSAFSSVKNKALNYARDEKYKDLRRFYYAIEKLVSILERQQHDKLFKDPMTGLQDEIQLGQEASTQASFTPPQSELILQDGTIIMKPLDHSGVSFDELPFNQWYQEFKELDAKKGHKRASLSMFLGSGEARVMPSYFSFGIKQQ